ncbi:hypothetical protein CSKR_202235 [Clonorchis sinensis]|uniref:Uncharacterized protein n=1 Tax=Clonorchis sinensis TaxID=79923 RepID=A0A8T1LY91_CLOSI|nr:hypothetical protein CSKR_202235 [Clonorchis sinensis]
MKKFETLNFWISKDGPLKHTVLPIINSKLRVRYADSTFIIVKRDPVQNAHEQLNTTSEDINFKIELERENGVLFSDLLENRLDSGNMNPYTVKRHAGQMLNYNRNHPINTKNR